MSQSNRIKGGTTDEAFQVQWDRGACAGLAFSNFKNIYMRKNIKR